MKPRIKDFLRQSLTRTLGLGLSVMAVAVLVGGCAHSRKNREVTMGFVAPQPPAFLAGPMAVVLTNTGGFSARVAFQTPQLSLPGEVQSGELLARGSKLLFAAHRNKALERYILPGGYSFLWDVAESRGYLISEALQGYAPVSLDLRVTNLVARANQAVSQQFEGHPCTTEAATAQLSDGSTVELQVWRATDLKGLPVHMTQPSTPTPITLNLSKVRLEPPPNDLFTVPSSFTKYPTPEAMVDELAIRRHNLKQSSAD